MKKLIGFIFIYVLLANCGISWAQKAKRDRFPSYFGIVASPIIPNNFIGDVRTNMQDSSGNFQASYNHKVGFTFGGIVRIGVTKTISIETGLSQVRRNYSVDASVPDSNFTGSQRLAFVNYDLPINGLFYVQLSEKWFMNAAIGFSITHYPSDSRDTIRFDPKNIVSVEARRTARTYFAANAGLGFEYRTEKSGTFYLGGGAKVPLKDPFYGVAIYSTSSIGTKTVAYSPISAGYFTFDIRYFFPNIRKSDDHFNKPLID